MLGTLIAQDILELRIAFRLTERGIFHDKVGIFTDEDDDRVAFTGSANETWSASVGSSQLRGLSRPQKLG